MSLRIAFCALLCASVALATTPGSAPITKSEDGDGGPAIEATINGPDAIALDEDGNLYIAELFGRRGHADAPGLAARRVQPSPHRRRSSDSGRFLHESS